MPPKKMTTTGSILAPINTTTTSSILAPIDPNQGNEDLIREARNQKKATSPAPREEELDEEISNLKLIHQQVEKHKEKMLRLSKLQRKIDEATEEMHNIEVHKNMYNYTDQDHDGHNHDNLRHKASPLTPELQVTPWPPLYRPPILPIYDGLTDPKQFIMSYEATISSYGGNSAVMPKSFVMAVRSVAQTWYSSLRSRTVNSWPNLKEIILTSFQGFQSKPVTAQALFQCNQELDEYLKLFV
jgi:hypothetical protein